MGSLRRARQIHLATLAAAAAAEATRHKQLAYKCTAVFQAKQTDGQTDERTVGQRGQTERQIFDI